MAAIIEGNINLTEGVYYMKGRIRFERNFSMCLPHVLLSQSWHAPDGKDMAT
jgi:hypothetical protein